MIIRSTFPQVYRMKHPATGQLYWLVSHRSKRWGMTGRKVFPNEAGAMDYARAVEDRITTHGKQSDIPSEKAKCVVSYEKLITQLSAYGRTPEEAVNHFVNHLGQETLKQVKPFINDLVEKWKTFKYADTTLSKKTVIEIRSYARFIKNKWGNFKPDDLKKNEIDLLIKGLEISNNTRRKYLRYIRMFLSWVKDEGHILQNPTDGIFYKPDDFDADCYDAATTSKLLQFVAENEKDLIGYYSLLTFAGLRPSEGARVQWEDYNFKTSQLYVRKGKTNARHITLEPVAIAWMKFHRKNTPQDKPFIDLCSLENREKNIRQNALDRAWIQDGLRHGFGTYYKSKIKSINHVADYMGNSPDVVKRHYARTIDVKECENFWRVTPKRVLGSNP